MADPVALVVAKLEAGGYNPRSVGDGKWESICPVHKGGRPNLSIGIGDNGGVLLHCHGRNCEVRAVAAAIGLTMADLFQRKNGPGTSSNGVSRRTFQTADAAVKAFPRDLGEPARHWTYHDADGQEVLRVYRFERKGAEKSYRPIYVTDKGWALGDPPPPLPLYRLPELDGAARVFVTEGEKCAEMVRELGLVATTSAHGANSPGKTDWSPLAGKEVVILPDNDAPGRLFAREVGKLLSALGDPPAVKVLNLPDVPTKGDIEQWLTSPKRTGPAEKLGEDLNRLADGAAVESVDNSEDDRPLRLRGWPAPAAAAAYYGLAGDIVRVIEPRTEADPVAILVQLLVGFGNLIGRSAHFAVEADRHYANEFVALVGPTSNGRKGTAWGNASFLLKSVNTDWGSKRIAGGLSSGEGLIHAVRDPWFAREPLKTKGVITGYQDVEKDPGESDKRLLCLETEFGGTLRVAARDGNSLSALVRQAWDTGELRTLTRNNPLKATGAHVSIVAHITRDELVNLMTRTDAANGFANRFLWLAVRRSKPLPFGGDIWKVDFAAFRARLIEAVEFGANSGRVQRSPEADRVWAAAYERLTEGRPGLMGALTSRAVPHVMRLAMLYALLDRSELIRAEHMEAALALWDYCFRSVAYIFGDSMGEPDADELLEALRAAPDGLTRSEIREGVFHRNKPSDEIAKILVLLADHDLAHFRTEATRGRPAQRWFAGPEPRRPQ